MEAEHREILRDALLTGGRTRSLKQALLEMPDVGDEADFRRVQDKGRKAAL